MIKDTCTCGAAFHVNYVMEADTVDKEHAAHTRWLEAHSACRADNNKAPANYGGTD